MTLALESGELMREVSLGGASVRHHAYPGPSLCTGGDGETEAKKYSSFWGALQVRHHKKVLVVAFSLTPVKSIL